MHQPKCYQQQQIHIILAAIFQKWDMQSTIAQKTNCNNCILLFAAELQQCQWNQVSIPYNVRGYHNRLQKSLDDS
jgi:hypothetical protein